LSYGDMVWVERYGHHAYQPVKRTSSSRVPPAARSTVSTGPTPRAQYESAGQVP
jgi:hypothetical protein